MSGQFKEMPFRQKFSHFLCDIFAPQDLKNKIDTIKKSDTPYLEENQTSS